MATRAFDVIIRRLATSCDFRIRLSAKDWDTLANRATELHARGIAVFRVVSCEVSDDQTPPLPF